ncbi:lipoprotein insertase outer membrane protein LolB [Vibrio sp. M60_M31a]
MANSRKKLEAIHDFQVTGKLGYIGPDQRQNLNFFWKHSTALSQLRLTTILGQTATKPNHPLQMVLR